jgi:hypothetical protein
MEREHDVLDLEAALKNWLAATIRQNERQRGAEAQPRSA